MIVISDTSPITNLIQIGRLDLLETVFNEIIIPKTVYDELCRLPEQKNIIDRQQWISIFSAQDNPMIALLEKELDKGEAEAIAISIQLKANFLIIDEFKGRDIAEKMGINIVGLLGILIKAKQQGIISEVKPLMEDLSQVGFRVNPILFEHILRITNEK